MRALATLVFASMTSACSFLDELAVSNGYQLDPNKIYLGTATLELRARDLDRYACVNGPLLCEQHGVSFDCSCVY